MSSTGHLLLVQRFFGFDDDDFGKTFVVLIQLGAILAILSIYFARLWRSRWGCQRSGGAALRHRRADRVPAGRGGRRARRTISSRACCSTPWVVCFTLIVGGAVLLWVDQHRPQAALSRRHEVFAADVSRHRPGQCLAMIPGVSRSGATIVVGHAARRRQALGRGVLVLPRDADHGRRLRLRSLQEPGRR